jgi:hypothetical protein
MTDEISFPPLRDLPSGRLEARRRHLLSEIARTEEPQRPRLRIAALAGAAASLAVVGAVLGIVLSGGSGAKASVLLVRSVRGPNWTPATVAGSGATVTELASLTSSPVAKTEVVGGTGSQQALLHQIVAGMQPTVIEKISITGSGDDLALQFTAAPGTSDTGAFWQESLVAAAFRDRANTAGANLTVRIFGGDADGAYLPSGTQLPAAEPGDAAAAKEFFESAAAKAGVSLSRLTIYRPDGIAVAATLESDDPASFLLHQMPAFLAALGDSRWTSYDGTFISLEDGSGKTVWESSTNGRLLDGSVGAAPYLAGCSPVANWGGFKTSPCPAK